MKRILVTGLAAVLASGAFGGSGELPEGYAKVDYIESSGGAYIDTEYHPTLQTRIVADFNPLEIEPWASFFGLTKNDASIDGILMRYYDYEDAINGWFCNAYYRETRIYGVANTRIQVELKAGGMTVNGSSATITTEGMPYDGSIYLFSVNKDGEPYRTHAMRLYSFTIYDADGDGNERKVCDLVPCVRKSDGMVGLYDLDGGRFMGNAGTGAFVAAKGDQLATVTLPKHKHVIASWTCFGGTVTNPVADASFNVLKGVPFKVMFAPSSRMGVLDGPAVYESEGTLKDVTLTEEEVPVAKLLPVDYIDADGSAKSCVDYDVVTESTSELSNGWYVVAENVSRGSIAVNGEVHLILMDGCELKANAEENKTGVFVGPDKSLAIYGQMAGTGKLLATGGEDGAGIGGQNPDHWRDYGACGSVTINGGTVTATGGKHGAGIGGVYSSGGTVTINGGTVTATGGSFGAGIGSSYWGCGGTVTINGGTVTATGGDSGAGIGGGLQGALDRVTIKSGKLDIKAGNGASVIGAGNGLASQGPISISGGIFAWKPIDDWLDDQSLKFFYAPDVTTCADYPWAILPAVRITFERSIEHLTAVWTRSEVAEATNAIGGTSFFVMKGATGAKVIFTPERNYRFVGVGETGVRVLASPLTEGCTIVPPEVEGTPGAVTNPWNVGEDVTAYMSDNGTLVIGGTGAMADFASAADVPWAAVAGEVTEVTVAEDVTHIGKNAFVGMADAVAVNGTPLSTYDMMAGARGHFEGGGSPSGAISGAEFEQVEIKDGKAYLEVSVHTNSEVKVIGEGEGWGVATNGVIEVPAPGKQGFFYLMSRPMGK